MNMKKLVILVFVVVLSVIVSVNVMVKDIIVLVVFMFNNLFFVLLKDGVQKEVDKFGYNLVVLDFQNNLVKELVNVQDLIVCGIKILLINLIDFDVVGNVVKMVNQVNILVIIFDCQVMKGEVVSYIVFDNVLGGKIVGDYIVKKVGEGVKVIEL